MLGKRVLYRSVFCNNEALYLITVTRQLTIPLGATRKGMS